MTGYENIIFADAAIDQAIEGVVSGIYFNQGHVCCAGSRLLVEESVKDIETAFQEAVNNYLDACKKLGQDPNKPYSGNIMLRVPAKVHAAVAATA